MDITHVKTPLYNAFLSWFGGVAPSSSLDIMTHRVFSFAIDVDYIHHHTAFFFKIEE